MRKSLIILTIGFAGLGLSSCVAAKVITAPVKLAGKAAVGTTKIAGKTMIGTAKVAGKTTVGGAKLAGKGIVAAGKGIYYVGSIPVKITDAALDTTARVLSITTQAVDLSGKVVSVTRNINAARLEAELAGLKTTKNILSVFVDVAK